MIINILAYLWYVLLIVPAFFWFFLVREFNKKAKTSFPSLVYAICYLIPFVHYWISWSFIKDIREAQTKYQVKNYLPVFKTYFWKLALPHFFLAVGLQLFGLLGIILMSLIPVLGELIMQFAVVVPYLSFVWLAWGFKSLMKTVRDI